jgi:hypothetical protein
LPFGLAPKKEQCQWRFKVFAHRTATGSRAPRREDRLRYFALRAVMIASATFFGASA